MIAATPLIEDDQFPIAEYSESGGARGPGSVTQSIDGAAAWLLKVEQNKRSNCFGNAGETLAIEGLAVLCWQP